jgi:hypothetical protein
VGIAMTDSYFDLFPFHISSRPALIRKAFSGSIKPPYYSAVWRHFLIIFSSGRESFYRPSEWLQLLSSSRARFCAVLAQFPDHQATFKRSPHYPVLMDAVAEAFLGITNALNADTLDAILSVVPFLVEGDSTRAYVHSLSFVAAHLFYQFTTEARVRESDDPRAVLMDSAFVLHDLWGVLKCLFEVLAPLFEAETTPSVADDIYWQLEWMIQFVMPGTDCTRLRGELGKVTAAYRVLFAKFMPARDDLLIVWTILFAHEGDLAIFHRFCACVWSTSGGIPERGELPMGLFRCQVGRWIFGVDENAQARELRSAAAALNNLLALLTVDSRVRREIVRFQIRMIASVARGTAHVDELLPVELLLQAVSGELE